MAQGIFDLQDEIRQDNAERAALIEAVAKGLHEHDATTRDSCGYHITEWEALDEGGREFWRQKARKRLTGGESVQRNQGSDAL